MNELKLHGQKPMSVFSCGKNARSNADALQILDFFVKNVLKKREEKRDFRNQTLITQYALMLVTFIIFAKDSLASRLFMQQQVAFLYQKKNTQKKTLFCFHIFVNEICRLKTGTHECYGMYSLLTPLHIFRLVCTGGLCAPEMCLPPSPVEEKKNKPAVHRRSINKAT